MESQPKLVTSYSQESLIKQILRIWPLFGILEKSDFWGSSYIITAAQPWARYLEGDKIPTKIGLGQVRIGIGMAIPTFGQIGIGIGMAIPSFGIKSWEKLGFSLIFPSFLGQKTPGKVRKSQGKLGQIWTFPDFKLKVRKSRDSPDFS